MYHFNTLTPITVIANIVIVPLLTPIIASGLITFLLYLASLPLAETLAFGNNFLLLFLMKLAHLFAQIPFASLEVPGPSLFLILAYYVFGVILFDHLATSLAK